MKRLGRLIPESLRALASGSLVGPVLALVTGSIVVRGLASLILISLHESIAALLGHLEKAPVTWPVPLGVWAIAWRRAGNWAVYPLPTETQ